VSHLSKVSSTLGGPSTESVVPKLRISRWRSRQIEKTYAHAPVAPKTARTSKKCTPEASTLGARSAAGSAVIAAGLLGGTATLLQVTPDIPDRRRAAQQQKEVRPDGPTASTRVSSPPVGTFPSAGRHRRRKHYNKPRSGSRAGAVIVLHALSLIIHLSKPIVLW